MSAPRSARPSARTRHLHLAAALVLAVGACSNPGGSPIAATTNGPHLIAEGIKFDAATLAVPAGQPFKLELVNRDAAPHNIAIYRDSSAADKLFGGEIVAGPKDIVYDVPELPAGTWFFRCDVHPGMQGQVVASPLSPTAPSS